MAVRLIPVLFAVYCSSVLVWSLLASHLCESLSRRHPLLYEALGRPAPLSGSDFRGEFALLRFLLAGRDRFTEDRRLVAVCGAMRVLLCVYVLFFLTAPGLFLG
ncbi:MAG TPA: hypothetical protein VE685_23055 [Thermoanaerobaculia bacterium]|nr:hypothetical protein [Thermoanaerobaculia bacterium]